MRAGRTWTSSRALLPVLGEPGFEPQSIRFALDDQVVGVAGEANPKYISTSYVERQNLTMRMSIRRFTRLTNAFSKKLENHAAAVALHYMHYNFCRVHQTLRVTPAMEAGLATRIFEIADVVPLLDEPAKRAA